MLICEHLIVLISGPPVWNLRVFSEAGPELQAVCRFGLPRGSQLHGVSVRYRCVVRLDYGTRCG